MTAYYERLFTRNPETRALFASTDMFEQRKKLLGALALVIRNLREPEVLTRILKVLGRRHVAYGIRPEHYPIVGAVLLETFADFLGEHWTRAHHDAWVQAYAEFSAIMLQGGDEPVHSEQAMVLNNALLRSKERGRGRVNMNKILRTVLVIVGMASLILAAGFSLQLPWLVQLWPWPDSFSPYLFLGSITAATAASLLWIGLSGELAAAAGGALHLMVFYAGLASSLFLLSRQGGDENLFMRAFVCAVVALISLILLLWFRRYPIQDSRPMPLPVRASFAVFVAVLVLAGIGILLHVPDVFAWRLHPTTSALLAWFFLGAACYFLYGLGHSGWQMACGQLWAFLAYDLVLIVPYLLHFALARPAQMPSLLINTLVLAYSAALAIYYLLVKQLTRSWRSRKRIHSAAVEELHMEGDFELYEPISLTEHKYESGLRGNERVAATVMNSHKEGRSA